MNQKGWKKICILLSEGTCFGLDQGWAKSGPQSSFFYTVSLYTMYKWCDCLKVWPKCPKSAQIRTADENNCPPLVQTLNAPLKVTIKIYIQLCFLFDNLQFQLTAVNPWQLNAAITEIAFPELVFATRDSPEPIVERIRLVDQV